MFFRFLLFLKLFNVQIAPAANPLVRLFGGKGADQPLARFAVGEDPDHPGTALDLLVEALQVQAVGGAQAQPMRGWESENGKTILDIILDQLGCPGIAGLPLLGRATRVLSIRGL